MKHTWNNPWTPLRIAVLAAAAFGTLFWLGSIVQWWRIANTRRDGFELMGLMLSTGFFVALVLPTLTLGLIGRWLGLGAILGLAVVVLATDTVWPWLPW
ncbi:MAG TPA: hypothetical protein VGM72_13645 [Micropepsaceae bacterium]|jgi:hypothetical protein